MPAEHRNKNVPNTAARHVNNAMRRVHPAQRLELLREMIAVAQAGISVIETGRAPTGFLDPSPTFAQAARELVGVDIEDHPMAGVLSAITGAYSATHGAA